MNLFDETENKYYKLTAYLLRQKQSYSLQEIDALIKEKLPGERDFEVTEVLFASEEGNGLVYLNDSGRLRPVLEHKFPIRNSVIENQAAKTLLTDKYRNHFLSENTAAKLKNAIKDVREAWNPADITIKNLFARGASEVNEEYHQQLSLIAKAVRNHASVSYDYIRPGYAEITGAEVFPVKIEFSVVNDRFRICAYNSGESRFVKMNLDRMKKIRYGNKISEKDLQKDYQEFIKKNTKILVLEADPVGHVIERCFRVFSYYDRRARYDREEDKYRLEISYMRTDEKEVIKNILSMGSYVIVSEPRQVREEVYRRILAASRLYDNS